MPDRYQESHIRHVPIFSQLSDYQFQLVARSFDVRRYNQGDYILLNGTEIPGLLIVADGQVLRLVSMPDGQLRPEGAVIEGQFLYQNALFERQQADRHLYAAHPTTILLLTRTAMGNLLSHHPELKPAFGLQRRSRDHHLHDVHFETQRENEEVLLKTRRHWFSFMRWMWIPVFIALVGLMLSAAFPSIAFITVPFVFVISLVLGGYIFLEWMNDSVIVTDQRVIRIIHTILTFHEIRNEVDLESIQEANAEIRTFDVFARIFRYGDVELKTAGSQGNFILDFMPNPEQLQELIIEDARNYMVASQAREQEAMRAELDRWMGGQYRAGQNPVPQQDVVNAASERKIKDIYSPGEGPSSPFVMSFPTESGGIVYRKHWFMWIRAVTMPTIWIIASLFGMLLMTVFAPLQVLGFIGWMIAFVVLLIGVAWFYLADWDWRHDYYLITDNNITIVNQRPLWLQNESDQILLKQVDNVLAETKGVFQQMFRYGDVRVALVGADNYKLFDNVANPRDVQSEITRRQQRMKQRSLEEQERSQREIIGEYLSLYHQSQANQEDAQVYPQNQPLPYEPQAPQQPAPNTNPSPSPFGQRPSISTGRPYQPTPNVPQNRPPQAPYQPAPTVPPQQAPYQPEPTIPSQGQVPPQQVPYQPEPTVPSQPQMPPLPPYQQEQSAPNLPPPPNNPYQPPSTDSGRPPKFPKQNN